MLSLIAPTGEALQAYCLSEKIPLESFDIDCGASVPKATLHTMNLSSKTAEDRTLFYFHGGAFMYPLVPGPQMPGVRRIAEAVQASKIIVLEYTLAPASLYPNQMNQGAYALQHLLNARNLTPENTILYGESAGGNLVLSLLAHLKSPHPSAPMIKLHDRRFKAALLSSPWVSLDTSTPSFAENASWDVFDAGEVTNFIANWQPKHKVWADMLEAEAGFWRDVLVETMCIVVGDKEVFRDGVVEFAKSAGATRYPDVTATTLYVGPHETHWQGGADAALGIEGTGSMMAMLDVIGQRL